MKHLSAFCLALCCTLPVLAQQQTPVLYNITEQAIAIDGYDPVAYFTTNQATLGKREHLAMFEGVIYQFSSADHKALFLENPAQYVPAYGGWCAFGFAMRPGQFEGWGPGKYKIDPNTFKIENDRLLLFYNFDGFDARAYWNANPAASKAQADAFWQENVLAERGKKPANQTTGLNPLAPPETQELAWFVGEWDVTWKQKSRPESDTYDLISKAIWRVRYTFDGFALVDEFTSANFASPAPWGDFRGMTFRAYNPQEKQWVMTYQHVNGSDMWRLTGKMEDGEFKLQGHDITGTWHYRPHFFNITEDSFSWTNAYSPDGGKTWVEDIARAEAKRIR